MTSKLTEKDQWAAFSKALTCSKEIKPTGDGWKTIPELMVLFDLANDNTKKRARTGLKAGMLEVFEGKEYRAGRLVRAAWYRPIKR